MDAGCMVVRKYAFAMEVQALAAETYEWVDNQTARERRALTAIGRRCGSWIASRGPTAFDMQLRRTVLSAANFSL